MKDTSSEFSFFFSKTAKLISAFVFATRIVQFLFFPNFKLLAIFCACKAQFVVRPSRKPQRPVFSRRGSSNDGSKGESYLKLISWLIWLAVAMSTIANCVFISATDSTVYSILALVLEENSVAIAFTQPAYGALKTASR